MSIADRGHSLKSPASRLIETSRKRTVSAAGVMMMTETTAMDAGLTNLGRGRRMSRQRKRDAVLQLLRGEDLELVSRALGVTAATLSDWRDTFLAAGEAGLATRATDDEAKRRARYGRAGGSKLAWRDATRARAAGSQDRRLGGARLRPFGPREAEAMSRASSLSSGKPHGVACVCRVWQAARATLYRHLGLAGLGPDRAPERVEPPRR